LPTSFDTFAISLPVDPSDRLRLHGYVVAVSLLSAIALAAVAAGSGRLAGLLPLAAGLLCHRRLAGFGPLPGAVRWDARSGWSLSTGEGPVPVSLCHGSWFGRRAALAAFRDGDDSGDDCGGRRRWLVPLRRPRGVGADDWRRLRVLWRTHRDALVANSSNC